MEKYGNDKNVAACREMKMKEVMQFLSEAPENLVVQVLFPLAETRQNKAGDTNG